MNQFDIWDYDGFILIVRITFPSSLGVCRFLRPYKCFEVFLFLFYKNCSQFFQWNYSYIILHSCSGSPFSFEICRMFYFNENNSILIFVFRYLTCGRDHFCLWSFILRQVSESIYTAGTRIHTCIIYGIKILRIH